MATCQDSWLDWVPGSGQSEKFVRSLKQSFAQKAEANAYTPLRPTTYLGCQITAVQPESVGMALGFSLAVDTPFGDMKKAIEGHMKKPLKVRCQRRRRRRRRRQQQQLRDEDCCEEDCFPDGFVRQDAARRAHRLLLLLREIAWVGVGCLAAQQPGNLRSRAVASC